MIDAGLPAQLAGAGERLVDGAVPSQAVVALRLVLVFLVLNRLIQDIYTLPIGVSLQVTDVVLLGLLVVWVLWMIVAPLPFPMGMAGVLGSALMVFVLMAPYVNAATMSSFEVDGAERGVVRAILYGVLFIATYHLASWRGMAYRIVKVAIAMTVFQALMAILEMLTKSRIQFLGPIWQAIGLEVDPRGLRGQEIALDQRLTGELRAQATAPHSLVLAGLLTVGIGMCVALYLHSDDPRARRRYLAAILVQLVGVGATNQKTGFLALGAVVLLLAITQVQRLPRAVPLIVSGVIGVGLLSVLSPETPRLILNFFTGETTDHNMAVRVSKYALLPELVGRRPLVGAGYITNDPAIALFDNAYLTQLVELGIVGLLLLLGFLLVVGHRPFSLYASAPEEEQPLLVAAMAAAVTLLITMATFDVLSFDQLFPTCLILLAIGLARTDAIRRWRRRELAVGGHPARVL